MRRKNLLVLVIGFILCIGGTGVGSTEVDFLDPFTLNIRKCAVITRQGYRTGGTVSRLQRTTRLNPRIAIRRRAIRENIWIPNKPTYRSAYRPYYGN